jgi:hypothetical protein
MIYWVTRKNARVSTAAKSMQRAQSARDKDTIAIFQMPALPILMPAMPVSPTLAMPRIFFPRSSASVDRPICACGPDVPYRLELDFLDALNGGKQQLTLPDGSVLDVAIPPGTRDGQILRLRGKGRPGIGGGTSGDALIEIHVRPHRIFARKGDDIHVELPVSLSEAVLGAKVMVPTPSGDVTMTIPKWSNTGTVLRLKERGVPRSDGSRGDEYVTLKVMLPEKPDPELERFIAQWRPATAPRERMGV